MYLIARYGSSRGFSKDVCDTLNSFFYDSEKRVTPQKIYSFKKRYLSELEKVLEENESNL